MWPSAGDVLMSLYPDRSRPESPSTPRFPCADLWGERVIRSVANLTRADGEEFFALVDGTAALRSCPVYTLLGIRTCQLPEARR